MDFVEYEKLNTNAAHLEDARAIEKGQGECRIENYKKTNQLRKNKVRQYINANFEDGKQCKFVTLTFKENIADVKMANKEFKQYIQRLKRYHEKHYSQCEPIKYIAVVEFQKRGAIHYHMLCNLPYIPTAKLSMLWGNGFVKINHVANIDNLGAYVTKYMTEDTEDERLMGLKAYNASNNLEKPVELKSWEIGDKTLKNVYDMYCKEKNLVYHANYDTDKAGTIVRRQFNSKRINHAISANIACEDC